MSSGVTVGSEVLVYVVAARVSLNGSTGRGTEDAAGMPDRRWAQQRLSQPVRGCGSRRWLVTSSPVVSGTCREGWMRGVAYAARRCGALSLRRWTTFRLTRWTAQFTRELLELLWALEATVDRQTALA